MAELRVPELAGAMRELGARVGVGELLGAYRALAAVDPASRTDSYHALRAVLCASRADLERFDLAWTRVFVADERLAIEQPEAFRQIGRLVAPRFAVPGERRRQIGGAGEEPEPSAVPSAYSDEELLRRRDFAAYTDADRRAARRLLARLSARGPRRLSRRTRPTPGRRRGERPDLRATARAALRHGGEPFERRWRDPTTRPRPLLLAVDVSGSMAPYARMLLSYTQACVAARRRVEAYAFGTRLTRVTRELAGRDPDRALARATRAVTDMGAGTRIGAVIAELNRTHGRRLGRSAVVVILSDGWDRGEPELLGAEMARLRRCAHRVIWLCPLAADPRFEPLTRGLRAALPHTDHLLAGNTIASLEELADLMEELDP